jgi:carbamoyltransferase
MRDWDIRVAIEQERLTRRKHGLALWYESPLQSAIEYCLGAEAISMADVDTIVSSDVLPASVRHVLRHHTLREFNHHLCHAASAYLMLPPGSRAGVLVYDGFGSICGPVAADPLRNLRETFSFHIFTPGTYECIGRTLGHGFVEPDDFPTSVTNSIGMIYELVTGLLGYDVMDAGKTMGLAAHGVPRYLGALEDFVAYGEEPSSCFRCTTDDPALVTMLEHILSSGRGSFDVKADLAASVQELINKTLLHCERFFSGYDIDYLCLSGGCGLNTVANSFLVARSTLNRPIFIPPHCGDSGIAFGALWLEGFERLGRAPALTFDGRSANPNLARPGRTYSDDERRRAVQQFYPRLMLDPAVTSARDLARVIANGMIVGILNGRSEVGPRALGGRSIVADPRSTLTRERINRLIKGREPFRPLAPLVLQLHFDEYFVDSRYADAFMLKVAHVSERCRRDAPAVVHVDGTARVQVVGDDGDPFLIALLEAFHEETGVGLLVNTSFNRKGEPLVESPLDAIDAFLGMSLDALYLDGEFYRSAASISPSR